LNEKHIYTVDVAFYTAEGFTLCVAAVMKIVMVAANIQFYATRMEQYGLTLQPGVPTQIIDLVRLCLLPFPSLAYVYEIVGGVFII